MPRTRFQTLEGKQMAAAQLNSQGGDVVLCPDGRHVSVSRSTRVPVQEQPIVRLTILADGARHGFAVTSDHTLHAGVSLGVWCQCRHS